MALHTNDKNKIKIRVPRFNGRPMLWFDERENSLEIRYGGKPNHDHDCGDFKGNWFFFENGGEWTPKDCVENGLLFLGYL